MAPLNLKSHTTDAQHVQAIRNGNRSDFVVLMRHYKTRVYAIALGLISDFDDAETVAQEAFCASISFARQSERPRTLWCLGLWYLSQSGPYVVAEKCQNRESRPSQG